ncbi:MAG: CarD family transcriptional regulator [Acetobacteraceae bacterium]
MRPPAKTKHATKPAPASLKAKQTVVVKAEVKTTAPRPQRRPEKQQDLKQQDLKQHDPKRLNLAPVTKSAAPPAPIAETTPVTDTEAPPAPPAKVAVGIEQTPPPPTPPPAPSLTPTPATVIGAPAAAVRAPIELRRVPAAPAPRGFATGVVRPGTVGGIASGRPIVGSPPRPLAPAENFVEGDHVVYPTHGVGKIERIVTESIAGYRLELIHITFEENRMTLRVPVEKARTAGLRKLASRQLFDAALTTLRGRARIKRTMWSRRAQEYEAKINSGDPLAIAEVVRDLHRNAGQPDQSFSERQIYEAAMDRLAAELAALDNTDKATAAEKLTTFMKAA